MRFISGFQAAALAGTLLLLPLATPSQAGGGFGGGGGGGFGGGFGGGHPGGFVAAPRPGVGVGAYGPGQGLVGAQAWSIGRRPNVIGPVWGGGWGGGYGGYGAGGGSNFAYGGSANVYNYNDYRRRDGGFYGGGGVFYGDNGYGRSYTYAPAHQGDYDAYGYRTPRGPGYADAPIYRPSQHIFYLPDNNRGESRKRARLDRQD